MDVHYLEHLLVVHRQHGAQLDVRHGDSVFRSRDIELRRGLIDGRDEKRDPQPCQHAAEDSAQGDPVDPSQQTQKQRRPVDTGVVPNLIGPRPGLTNLYIVLVHFIVTHALTSSVSVFLYPDLRIRFLIDPVSFHFLIGYDFIFHPSLDAHIREGDLDLHPHIPRTDLQDPRLKSLIRTLTDVDHLSLSIYFRFAYDAILLQNHQGELLVASE